MTSQMKNLIILLLTSLTLCSCEGYKSEFPVDDVANSLPCDDLLGEWYLAGKTEGEFQIYSALDIYSLNKQEYLIKCTFYDYKERSIQQVDNYRLFKSKIDKVEYLNIQPISNDESNTFSLWKYDITNYSLLNSHYLGKSFNVEFSSTEDYHNYVKTNQREIAAQFDTLEQIFIRPFGFPWNYVNNNSLDQLESFQIITSARNIIDYQSMTDSVIKQQTSRKINVELAKEKLNMYHFSHKPISAINPNPQHAYMTFKNGTLVRIKIFNENEIYDVDSKRLFVWDENRSEEKTNWIRVNN